MPKMNSSESIKEYYCDLRQTLILENARPIYDGITDLYQQLLRTSKEPEIEKELRALHLRESDYRFCKICTSVRNLITSAYKDGELIQQNPNYGFLSFWRKCFNSSPKDNIGTISNMLIYHDLLHDIIDINRPELDKKKEYDDLPYLYENLCGYIQKIMGCWNSFIIHHVSCGDTHIVARSAYLAEEVESATELKASDVENLLTIAVSESPRFFEISFGKQISVSESQEKYPYWLIPLYKFNEDEFYLLLQYKDYFPKAKELIKILFARDHLKNAILRDYEHLLNLRYELGFVRFFKEKEANDLQYPVILHTSDLHADKVNPVDKCRDSALEDLESAGDIDLFVLSGDIVDAKNSNASQTQENYDYAADIIRKFVSKIWCIKSGGDERVSFDWKRRIIFVPGNHDFAAMNLVKAVFKQRTLAAGLPYDGSNKIVAKFAYYLNFVQELLDAPIDQLIKNDINEVREYRRMHTKVLMLNSSYDASSIRTNKVRVNEEVLKRLTGSETWCECSHSEKAYRVCVVHHPPFESTEYTLDYTLDGYDDAVPGWVWGKGPKASRMNELYDEMNKVAMAVSKKERYVEDDWKNFKDTYIKVHDTVKKINAQGDRNGKYYFTKDAKTLFDYFNDGINKEYAEKLISDIVHNRHIADQDSKEFQKCTSTYVSSADLILCGHVHAKNEMPAGIPFYASDFTVGAENRVSIAGKFLLQDEEWDKKKATGEKHFLRIIRVSLVGEKYMIDIQDKPITGS